LAVDVAHWNKQLNLNIIILIIIIIKFILLLNAVSWRGIVV
jgi:hypothetical protein